MPKNAEIRSQPIASSLNRAIEALATVRRTAAALDHAMNEALKPYGITVTQYEVLRTLGGAEGSGLNQRELGERLTASVPDVSRLLDRMVERQLIARDRDPDDRRHVRSWLTADGVRVVEQLTPTLRALAAERFGRLGDRELHTLVEALDEVRDD